MGSLYLGGPTIQEVDGKMMMGLCIYGVAVISGSLYSRFYGICIIFIRSQSCIRNGISLMIFLVVLKETRKVLKRKLLHAQKRPLTSSPMQKKLITGTTLRKEHYLPKLFNILISPLPCIPYVGLCHTYQDWKNLLRSPSKSYFMS